MSDNQTMVSAGLSLIEKGLRQERRNDAAFVQPLVVNTNVAATLIAIPSAASQNINVVDLKRKLNNAFGLDELQEMCFNLGIDYEDIAGDTRNSKFRNLILLLERRDRLPELVAAAAEMRPERNWEVAPAVDANFEPKLDVAIVVDMTRRSIPLGVAQYLDDRNISANFLLMRTADDEFLSPDRTDWPAVLKGFADAMVTIKRTHTGARTHFFLSGPGAILFGMGCVWGTVDEALVYHYQDNTYYEVFSTSRDLR